MGFFIRKKVDKVELAMHVIALANASPAAPVPTSFMGLTVSRAWEILNQALRP